MKTVVMACVSARRTEKRGVVLTEQSASPEDEAFSDSDRAHSMRLLDGALHPIRHDLEAESLLDPLSCVPAHPAPRRLVGIEQRLDGRRPHVRLGLSQQARRFCIREAAVFGRRAGIDDALEGSARVGREHGHAARHGFDGHDAEVLVCGRVEENLGRRAKQQRGEQHARQRREKDDALCGHLVRRRNALGRLERLALPEERRVRQLEGGSLRLELAQRVDVVAHAPVVPARDDQAQLARRRRERFQGLDARKRLERKSNVLLGFETVDRDERDDALVAACVA